MQPLGCSLERIYLLTVCLQASLPWSFNFEPVRRNCYVNPLTLRNDPSGWVAPIPRHQMLRSISLLPDGAPAEGNAFDNDVVLVKAD